eukprot:TRINITY_DN63688_c0_g2_i1.p1 TRINITY_DN63688_c0_g2~~TRINITY_DN63688_c0_g2_i1.p1  ORF type:complete len:520 (+),score=55.66 TRINITY_DN63688_c0_g2_i1:23-1582(+)
MLRHLLGALVLGLVLSKQQPNIIMILVDDLGYHNVGFHNPQQISPNINRLSSSEGVTLEGHYTYVFCSPTRSSFLSGRLPIHVNEKNPEGIVKGGIDLRMTLIGQKLQSVGYETSALGKWHCGAYCDGNVPYNRGFNKHLGFLGGGEDHFTQRSGEMKGYVDLWADTKPAWGRNGTYSCYLYGQQAVSWIEQHDTNKPMFMYLAFHDTHAPYEVTNNFRDPKVKEHFRQTMQAMLTCVDQATGNVTAALKAKGMWNNTLMVWSSDNGGPQYWDANNYPLRGGKGNNFQGGVRTAAFVSGGLVPTTMRNKVLHQYIHVCDWYTTFAKMAGADPNDPVKGLPDVDGLDVWKLISGENMTSPRVEIPLSSDGLIVGDWKYVAKTGHDNWDRHCRKFKQDPLCNMGYWTPPVWPVADCGGGKNNDCPHNCTSSIGCTRDPGCPPEGCLFNLKNDPLEKHDLSKSNPVKLQQMRARFEEILKTKFQTTDSDAVFSECETWGEMIKRNRGFAGPLCRKWRPKNED